MPAKGLVKYGRDVCCGGARLVSAKDAFPGTTLLAVGIGSAFHRGTQDCSCIVWICSTSVPVLCANMLVGFAFLNV